MPNKRNEMLVFALLLMAAFSFRVVMARLFPNDTPDDSKIYAQIARNVLEHHVYSHAIEPPYDPSLIRLPGYPLFLAGVYSISGHYNNTAVRVVQALIDSASCGLIALVAFYWEPNQKLKRRTSIAALALAAPCPFTTIYVATILTETPSIFFTLAMCLSATLAFKTTSTKSALWLWAATGLIAGVAVLFRPDSALFAAAIGITLVVSMLFRRKGAPEKEPTAHEFWRRFFRVASLGVVFSSVFCLVLVPWTIRNFRVFHLFQPLAPAHAEMPGEFVPRGYLSWLRTWIDDGHYIGPVLWALDESPITVNEIPDRAFDSAEEKQRVAALLEKYNHPPDEQALATEPGPQNQSATPDQLDESQESESATPEDESTSNDQGDEADEGDESSSTEETSNQPVEMTPEIDAGFAEIARERVARYPVRYYFWLPAKRAFSLWFDTHSQYYPFEGELLPLADLDYDIHQQFWLPLFAGLTFIYTLLGVAGAWFLWQSRDFAARRWLLLAALMIFLRLGFFAILENPEPRYVVELFPFLSILGGIALTRLPRK
jgi:hypothetical protein